MNIKAIILGTVAAVMMAGAVPSSTRACCPCGPRFVIKKEVCWVTKVCYETRTVPYKVCVTKYDCCGCPYHRYETRYRVTSVRVCKRVPVVKYCKIPVY